jgi:hypothetical protein
MGAGVYSITLRGPFCLVSPMRAFGLLLLASVWVVGCTWVKPDAQGELVNVVYTPAETRDCQELGSVTVSVKADIAGIDRNEVKVRDELESLARNQAATMNADTILPKSDVVDGEQEFFAFRCAQ